MSDVGPLLTYPHGIGCVGLEEKWDIKVLKLLRKKKKPFLPTERFR